MAIINYQQFQVLTEPNPNRPGDTLLHVLTGPHALAAGGIMMDVEVGIDEVTAKALASNYRTGPSSIIVKGLVDTGCTTTAIDNSLVTKLGLPVIGFAKTATAIGVTTVNEHVVSIGFPGSGLCPKPIHKVQAINLEGQLIQILLGRDLLTAWTITYNGPSGFVSIAD